MAFDTFTVGTKPPGNAALRATVSRLIETRLVASSGAGKSWALRRLLEQTFGKVQHIVLDSEDEFYTLCERFDYALAGRDGGYCPVDVRSAPLLAHRLLELGVSPTVGTHELKVHERLRFVRLFMESTIAAPRNFWHPTLVVVDEAHIFCPQNGWAERAGAVIDLMTRGRKRGFSGFLATQRIPKLHKDAAAEANNKLIGHSVLDVDMKRGDELGFSGKEERRRLRELPAGQFFAFEPAFDRPGIELVKVGEDKTTHPRVGQGRVEVAPVTQKVKAVLSKLADLSAEQAKQEQHVAALQVENRRLQRELADARASVNAGQSAT